MGVSIGRRIYYYPNPENREQMGQEDATSPFDAGVIFVRKQATEEEGIVNPALVNLQVTSHDGSIETFFNVPLVEDRDPTEEERISGYCAWMPYQVAKAAEAAPAPEAG